MGAGRSIEIYDTTLRDGVQGAGVSFSTAGKLRIAQRLDAMGFTYIEGGYPGSNASHSEFFRAAPALRLKNAMLVAFGMTRRVRGRASDDVLVRNLLEANTPVVAVVGKAWRLHVRDVLRTTCDENLAMIADTIRHLRAHGRRVFFDAEHFFDGFKDDAAFAMEAVRAAAEAGAERVILCDTNGGSVPHEVHAITRKAVLGLPVPVGIHAHNDSGMAAANSVEAVRAGAVQVQGTINGYGERCGNADLCTVIPTLALKLKLACLPIRGLRGLFELSAFVDDVANLRHDERRPYVGRSAFAHKSGLHADAVEKNPLTMEHIAPELVGNERTILVGELSGKSSVLIKAIEMGVMGLKRSSQELPDVLAALKEMENKGYAFEAANASFHILVQKVLKKHQPFFELEGFRVIVEKRGRDEPCLSEATIKVRVKEGMAHTVGEGDGPVEALDRALRKALHRFYPGIAKVLLTDFQVRILDPKEATGATTRVLIESSDGDETWGTVGVSPNIIEASWEALVDSVEYKLFREEERRGRSRGRGPAGGPGVRERKREHP